MKSKLVIASLLLAGACAANLNAQEKTNYYTPKWSDNISSIILSLASALYCL